MLIYDLNLPALETLMREWNEPAYRAKQIWQGLYQKLYSSPEQFSNLPAPLRAKIAEHCTFVPFHVKTYLDSSDQSTRKTLFQLPDGNLIESVLMRYGDPADDPQMATSDTNRRGAKNRRTLCISTQAGCAMGCVFCATGQLGFKRNLTSGEIVAQVMYYAQMLKEQAETVSNVVFMGMGEPFHNYENVMAAIDILNDGEGYKFGARRLTISTVGLVPQIRRFADEQRQVNLAISLHAADDDERLAIMPVNKRYKIDDVIDACKYYIEKTHRRVTFEWALINGVNDTPEVAQKLARRLKGLLCHVNAIPLNPTQGYDGEATDRQRAQAFKETLEQAGIPCTIRMRRGIDINAGCGQLAGAESQ
ncbi:MAG: 23S rRNA (adenine(2503)-C(2))-methyltransferase RlmN [Anaerolineales bacterium]|jgi:23S rRNA (adenine2503-C2)-methyltransferase|uniref:23S rRNA (adenine(2503)-C(2))-methyltransferase RlmN n=1 Tax=Candidatus Villigracilis vicinus TaxID=3140679 RepID=UPI0031360668|nr:23S rRNA (adenine(2503)-C(2))-methyltransferase RlmN [Anaerolineales bacterium]MBK9779089.1 23S rRNA (adenine(2503)-C(2))-methyltransferase RlmN [Anaerolineales bacterium]